MSCPEKTRSRNWSRLGAWLFIFAAASAQASDDAYRRISIEFDLPESINPGAFTMCAEHGCNKRVPIHFNQAQWQQIRDAFQPPATDAAAERQQIASAIARMEILVAATANTGHDKGGDFNGILAPGSQLDCVDESVNTTTYLSLFELQGLLHWHKVLPRLSRGYLFFGGWPHFTAVVETLSEPHQRWVVDSWFRDNGVPPDVLQAAKWKDGWSPPGFSM